MGTPNYANSKYLCINAQICTYMRNMPMCGPMRIGKSGGWPTIVHIPYVNHGMKIYLVGSKIIGYDVRYDIDDI